MYPDRQDDKTTSHHTVDTMVLALFSLRLCPCIFKIPYNPTSVNLEAPQRADRALGCQPVVLDKDHFDIRADGTVYQVVDHIF